MTITSPTDRLPKKLAVIPAKAGIQPANFILYSLLSILFLTSCSDITHITRGDHLFNEGSYAEAIKEYEKVVAMTTDRKSPYFGLPTGDEARKKVEISNLAMHSKDNFIKGSEAFWKGDLQTASDYYRDIDIQFLPEKDQPAYEKNRKELLDRLAKVPDQPPTLESAPAEPVTPPTPASPPLEAVPVVSAPEVGVTRYFPLAPGSRFKYRSSVPIGTRVVYQTLEEEVLAEITVNEKHLIPVKRTQSGQPTDTLYYQVQPDQVILVAERKPTQEQVVFYEFPIAEIRSPLEIGSSWVTQGSPHRERTGTRDSPRRRIPQRLRITEESELVKTVRWYAPGIGIVKQERITFPGKSYESHFTYELSTLNQ